MLKLNINYKLIFTPCFSLQAKGKYICEVVRNGVRNILVIKQSFTKRAVSGFDTFS